MTIDGDMVSTWFTGIACNRGLGGGAISTDNDLIVS